MEKDIIFIVVFSAFVVWVSVYFTDNYRSFCQKRGVEQTFITNALYYVLWRGYHGALAIKRRLFSSK